MSSTLLIKLKWEYYWNVLNYYVIYRVYNVWYMLKHGSRDVSFHAVATNVYILLTVNHVLSMLCSKKFVYIWTYDYLKLFNHINLFYKKKIVSLINALIKINL